MLFILHPFLGYLNSKIQIQIKSHPNTKYTKSSVVDYLEK